MTRPGGGVPSPATLRSALRTSMAPEHRSDDVDSPSCQSDGCPQDRALPTCPPAASSPKPHRRSWQGGVQESESPRPARTSNSGGAPMSPVSWGKSISRRLSNALMRLGSGLGLKTSTSEPVMHTSVEVIASDDDRSPVSRRIADWAKQKTSRRLALTKTSIIVHRHHFERCPPSRRLNATYKLGSLDGRSSPLTADLDAQFAPGNAARNSPEPVLIRVGTQPREGRESPFPPARHSYNGWASDHEENVGGRGRPGSGDTALPMVGSSAPATPGSPGSPGGGFLQRGPSLQRPRSPSQPGSLPAGRALSRVQGESRLGKAASSRIHPSLIVPLPADAGS